MTTLAVLLFSLSDAQDFPFTQFYANPLYLNPALAGTDYCSRVQLNHRNQWPALPGIFVMNSLSYDVFSEFFNGGLGIRLHHEREGEAAIEQLQLSAMYSHRIYLSNSSELRLALEAGYGQRATTWADFILPSSLISGFSTPPPGFNESIRYPDFATGFLFGFDERFYLGGAIHHLNRPNIAFLGEPAYKTRIKYTLHAGAIINRKDKRSYRYGVIPLEWSPGILYQRQGDFHHLNVGNYVGLSPFVFGLWFRHTFGNADALNFLIGLQQDRYRIGYSYDYTISGLGRATGGSHEISLAYIFPCRKKSIWERAIKCPGF